MARRTAVDEGPDALDEPWDEEPKAPKKRWSGGGGRWWIWVGRVLLWAFVLVVVVNGIRAPFERFTEQPPATSGQSDDREPRFPQTQASAYALQFAHVYLNYDENSAGGRQEELARFLPEGANAQLGWNGLGQLSAQHIEVLSVDVKDANNALVNIAAKAGSRWVTLAVPVYTRDGALVIAGRPALLEAPKKAQLPQEAGGERDQELEARLQTDLAGFFQAYGNSDAVNLQRFTEGGGITGLGAAVNFGEIREVNAPPGDSDERTVTATVMWKVPPTQPRGTEGQLEQTYELVVVKKSDQWNVRSIRGAVRAGS
ncbi:conjugal transfer protein [Actinocorallia populi]|uniref:conjugal transfer protein n=1 Tax=Actinocorallia populi TaxID=2079200 RepID=UPI000D08E14B|nr:conjugal transfer protein [Actinocorallia populi]